MRKLGGIVVCLMLSLFSCLHTEQNVIHEKEKEELSSISSETAWEEESEAELSRGNDKLEVGKENVVSDLSDDSVGLEQEDAGTDIFTALEKTKKGQNILDHSEIPEDSFSKVEPLEQSKSSVLFTMQQAGKMKDSPETPEIPLEKPEPSFTAAVSAEIEAEKELLPKLPKVVLGEAMPIPTMEELPVMRMEQNRESLSIELLAPYGAQVEELPAATDFSLLDGEMFTEEGSNLPSQGRLSDSEVGQIEEEPAASSPFIISQEEETAGSTFSLNGDFAMAGKVIENPPVDFEYQKEETAVLTQTEEKADLAPLYGKGEDEISVKENKELNLTLNGNGWLLNEWNRSVFQLLERKNLEDKTWFRLKAGSAGKEKLGFIRYNEAEDQKEAKFFSVVIMPQEVFPQKKERGGRKQEKNEEKDYRRSLADNLFAKENYAQALSYYRMLVQENQGDSELYYKAAKCSERSEKMKEAAEFYLKNLAEEGNPFYDDAIIEYVRLLKSQKEFQKGIQTIYQNGLTKEVGEKCVEELYKLLGDLLFNKKDYPEAVRIYKTVLSQYPNTEEADKVLFYLAYSLELQNNPEFEEAKRIYQTLQISYPESKYLHLSKSRVNSINRHYIKIN